MNQHDSTYHNLLRHILANGTVKTDRTGTGTIDTFGYQMRFDLSKGFPLLTTKKLPFKLILSELLWFIAGDTKLKTLLLVKNHIWDEWPYKGYLKATDQPVPKSDSEEWASGLKSFTERILNDDDFAAKYGDLGPVYGYQWRSWPNHRGGKIDQLKDAINTLKKNPDSRRNIICAWNPSDLDEMAKSGLPPCHCLFQFDVTEGKLSCQLYQRSCDTFLGVPFNIASYALLTLMLSHVCGLEPGEFVWTGGSVHIYSNHVEQVNEQLSRDSKSESPTVWLDPKVTDLFNFTMDDVRLDNYDPHPAIKAPIAV